MRGANLDHICSLCNEFDVDQAVSNLAAQGMDRCLVPTAYGPPHLHVAWDG